LPGRGRDTVTVNLLVLCAALLHASWNALLHGTRDRFLAMTWMSMAIAAIATLCIVLGAPAPAAAAWPWIVASALIHIVYNCCLVWSYRIGDFSRAYPIARGTSPLLVTLGALLTVQEAIAPIRVAGVVMVCGGIILLAVQRGKLSRSSAVAALTTGAVIALYTVVDGIGVRLSNDQSLAYTPWMFAGYWLMVPVFLAMRGAGSLRQLTQSSWASAWTACVGGLISVLAYGIVIWAMQSGPMGAVSALRETSVVFAVLIARVVMREAVSRKTWLACVVIAAGAICLTL
jgi:drug/metabolite transporter (DMT)-like permease